MRLIRTSLLTLISTSVKIVSGVFINKAVAYYAGPSGMALIGQFQNFSQLALTLAQGAINTGVTKFVAEYRENNDLLIILISTAYKISILSSVLVSLFMLIWSTDLSYYFFHSYTHKYVFQIYGITIFFFVLNNLLLSIINGLKEIDTLVKINILQSIYSLILTTYLIYCYGLSGALIASVTNQSVIFLLVIWMLRRHLIINFKYFNSKFNKVQAKKLAKFGLMTLTSAITVPLSHLIIRNYIITSMGWESAGYWQAIWYVSNTYLMVVTTTLGVYYLPRLSELNDKNEIRSEILQGYKIIMPIVIISSTVVFILKDYIIRLLFTENFNTVHDLFFWQLIGDVIKIAAWLISYLMLAKSMTKIFIITEIIFNINFIFISIFMLKQFGLIGVTYSFALNYLIYFITVILLTRREWTVELAP